MAPKEDKDIEKISKREDKERPKEQDFGSNNSIQS